MSKTTEPTPTADANARFLRLARACALADRCHALPKGEGVDEPARWDGPTLDELEALDPRKCLSFTYPGTSDGPLFAPETIQTAQRVDEHLEVTEEDGTVWEIHFIHRSEARFVPDLDGPRGAKTATVHYPPGPCRDRLTVVARPLPDGPPASIALPLPNDPEALRDLIKTLQSFLPES